MSVGETVSGSARDGQSSVGDRGVLVECEYKCGIMVDPKNGWKMCRNCYFLHVKNKKKADLTPEQESQAQYDKFFGTCPKCGGQTKKGKLSNNYHSWPVEFCFHCDEYIHRA